MPPYFNAPFDYPDLFDDYHQFLNTMGNVAKEIKRVLQDGRIVACVVDDAIVDGQKFPVVADVTQVFELHLSERLGYRIALMEVKVGGYHRFFETLIRVQR